MRARAVLLGMSAIALVAGAPVFAQDASAYERAVAARQAGDAATAERLLGEWLAADPGDVDARVQLGYALLSLGRPEEAADQFRAVLAAAPDYADARDGLALATRRLEPVRDDRRGFVLVEGALSDFSDPICDWQEAGVTMALPVAARDTLDARGTYYRRFGFDDVELAAGYTHRAGKDTWLRFAASGTPSADFRPEIGLGAGIDQRVVSGPAATVLGLDASWRRFPLQDVWTVSPAITQYFGGNGAFSLTARADAVVPDGQDLRIGGLLRFDHRPDERRRAFVGIASGPDTDIGRVVTTRSVFGGGELPLGEALSVTGSVARDWRDGPLDRTEFRIGVKAGL